MTLASPQGQSCCRTGHLQRPSMLGRCLRHVGAIQRQLAGAAHYQVHLKCMATVSKADTRAKLMRESPADPTAEAKVRCLLIYQCLVLAEQLPMNAAWTLPWAPSSSSPLML